MKKFKMLAFSLAMVFVCCLSFSLVGCDIEFWERDAESYVQKLLDNYDNSINYSVESTTVNISYVNGEVDDSTTFSSSFLHTYEGNKEYARADYTQDRVYYTIENLDSTCVYTEYYPSTGSATQYVYTIEEMPENKANVNGGCYIDGYYYMFLNFEKMMESISEGYTVTSIEPTMERENGSRILKVGVSAEKEGASFSCVFTLVIKDKVLQSASLTYNVIEDEKTTIVEAKYTFSYGTIELSELGFDETEYTIKSST